MTDNLTKLSKRFEYDLQEKKKKEKYTEMAKIYLKEQTHQATYKST